MTWQFGQAGAAWRHACRVKTSAERSSTQEGLLKNELKFTYWAERAGEHLLQVLDGLQEGIGLAAGRRRTATTQPTAQFAQPSPQPCAHVVERFQRPRQVQRPGRGAQTLACQPPGQQPPQVSGPQAMARQHSRQQHGKRMPTTAPLAAVGAEDPLPPQDSAGGLGRVVAVKQTVPVQGFGLIAAGTALLFERKSSCWRAAASRRKRNSGAFIRRVSARSPRRRRGLLSRRLGTARLGSKRLKQRGDGTDGTLAALPP